MSISVTVPTKAPSLRPRIIVFGVGGGGGNAVNNMIHSHLEGVEFIVTNTDAQSLAQSAAERRIQIGERTTKGLGAGSCPQVGYEAAEESAEEIADAVEGAHMIFITAGMGGGTGTGAAPVLARLAKDQGILTVGVVTKPFHFEGARRMETAERGISEIEQYTDTLLVIPNQNLFRLANERTTMVDSFMMADRVLHSAVSGITNLMIKPGIINLDFADVREIMGGMGKAVIGTGEAEGEKRGIEAAEAAIANPLLDDVSMKGARGVLISVTGSEAMTLYEIEEAAKRISSEVTDENANIIFGASHDESLNGAIRVSVVATGIDLPSEETQGSAGGIASLDKGRRGTSPASSRDEERVLGNAPSSSAPLGEETLPNSPFKQGADEAPAPPHIPIVARSTRAGASFAAEERETGTRARGFWARVFSPFRRRRAARDDISESSEMNGFAEDARQSSSGVPPIIQDNGVGEGVFVESAGDQMEIPTFIRRA